MSIVKFTNKVALISAFLLMYWVFIFVCNSVFGFKIFRQNLTELFAFSVLGIMAILFAVIVLNVMYNLTAIADRQHGVNAQTHIKRPKLIAGIICGSFLVLFALMYFGDRATAQKKQQYLVNSADELMREHQDIALRLTDFSYSKAYINTLRQDLRLLSQVEEKFPKITIVVLDEIDNKPVLRGFYGHSSHLGEDDVLIKTDHIFSTSSEERDYLYAVFSGESVKHRFSSHDGHYELYYPVTTEKGVAVLLLTKRSRYGKFGS